MMPYAVLYPVQLKHVKVVVLKLRLPIFKHAPTLAMNGRSVTGVVVAVMGIGIPLTGIIVPKAVGMVHKQERLNVRQAQVHKADPHPALAVMEPLLMIHSVALNQAQAKHV